ncbi:MULTISPECIES: S-layer homology domain-containing protein [Aneurinibacillus]|uniref:S-layer homology domain-containing protein n=1 Tax=Aneurinibacillus thermoaerophilus TaxID=143495 RepID=A0A1G7Z871_ANETH|nr:MULTISPECIES: S-layer homology domain-containing protein [Aneurinibacillus]AMA72298.1 hypothetical protein ACH33_05150 [Aneurinibacillus sp. XH2]MED0674851.1 S-layer homology domain-containing protein [Aneurinibacillus thermoaerophilus]MED0679801.1 S-layer homology domain-containing protein [Aneurinibacillus thermoaerophilus]MED0735833.1 S-layer homology domain-containing protein [Aneurinibacillus thermoaerophilus]MED0758497.1 S-layer homology domain-containing protein [Aneurinibacillus the
MKKRNIAVTGLLSLTMLTGVPAVNVLAAEPVTTMQAQTEQMTRGEFFVMLARAIDLPEAEAQYSYKDVERDSELARIVSKLQANGVLSGYDDGMVYPKQVLKEGEAIAMLSRALGIPEQEVPGVKSPLPSSHWAHNTASWLAAVNFDYKWDNLERPLTKQVAEALIQQMLSTSDSTKKLLEESQKAQRDVRSFRMEGTVAFSMEGNEKTLASLPEETRKEMLQGVSMNIKSTFEVPDKMYIQTSMKAPAALEKEGMDHMAFEQYILGKDMYMKMPDNLSGGMEHSSGWVKMKNGFPIDMKAMVEQMSGIPPQLEKKLFYRDLGEGKIAFQGRIDKLSDLTSMMNGMQGMTDTLKEAEGVIGSIYMQGVMELDPATKLVKRIQTQTAVTYKDNIEDMPFKRMIMTQDMKYSDYNDNLKVQLPEEAKKAKELPAALEGISASQADKK